MSDQIEAQRLLAAYRRMIMPEAVDRAQAWARLEAADEHATPSGSRGRAWWIVAAALAAAAIVAALAWPSPERTAAREVDPREQSVHGRVAAPHATPTQTRDVLPPAELPAMHVESVVAPPAPAPERPRVVAADPLRAELEAISAARAALDRGDLDGALARVAAYRRRFADGVLAIEARAIGAAARCRRGPLEDGRAQARAVLVDAGAAAYRDLLRDACDLQ
jgi:hypothetical protein